MNASSTARAVEAAAVSRMSPRWLEWFAVLLMAAGVVLLVLPASVDVPPRPAMSSSEAPVPSGNAGVPKQELPDVRDALVRTNLFSATRRAPTQRFVVPGQELATPAIVPEAAAPSSESYGVQLFGVLEVVGSRRALLQAGSADSVPRVVQTGDRIGGYRVRRILADRVELSSASGTRIVRLQRRPVSDSSGVVP